MGVVAECSENKKAAPRQAAHKWLLLKNNPIRNNWCPACPAPSPLKGVLYIGPNSF